jgi:paraquat-inducible protein B
MNRNTAIPADNTTAGPPGHDPLPQPIVKKMRWPFPIIWIVPITAAALAGYFLYERHQEQGREITIEFDEVAGIKPDDTTIAVRGVTVGRVRSMELTEDHRHVLVHVRLSLANSSIARQDTIFWLVRPEVSLENISALSTVVSGPYIEAKPGTGAPATTFKGLDKAPVSVAPGIEIILHAVRVDQLTGESPVSYRGIQVGVVRDIQLSNDADTADVKLHIWDRYAPLIRANSQFWMTKAADIQGGLFSGIKLKLNSVRTLLTGGVSFATPDKNAGNPVSSGAQFFLNEQPKEEWLKWSPKIRIPPDAAPSQAQSPATQPASNMLPALKHE